ncbi:MAG TPA: peptidoglycan bridge formation glycyltransferase FemA/FemB family protein [Candidatus Moranbacteria bacterium]|nr:peptidoglycan bridge formation glycyltransferase FemA/FemB family protein [Candidatus Moranbacteria bacterium]
MDSNFLQSKEWRGFQEVVGRKTSCIDSENFSASIIEHNLPIVGKYFYIPKGPIIENQNANLKNKNDNAKLKNNLNELIDLAEKEKAGWIRIEPENEEILEMIKKNIKNKITKAPHEMQPRESLILDITKTEEELLAEMKSKTRYNIKVAEKHGVKIKKQEKSEEYIEEFLRLTKIMAKRQGIETHSGEYYQKMFEIIPGDVIKLYVAEYKNRVIAANIMIFFGDTATYLHGASDDQYRNVMAPYLLQWQAIKDAKAEGFKKYDFFGVKVKNKSGKSWEGITRFKTGFSPSTDPIEFPGCYDIVINPIKYWVYRIIQKTKSFVR